MSALYTWEDGVYLPGPLTVGPWSPDAQHGGPVSALLAGAVEDQTGARQVVRVTVELLRPGPLTPLSLATDVVRPGRNVELVEARLAAGDKDVAWARALRIRRKRLDVPVDRSGPPAPLRKISSGGPPVWSGPLSPRRWTSASSREGGTRPGR